MSLPVNIRIATEEDIEQIVQHGKSFLEYHPMKAMIDEDYLEQVLLGVVKDGLFIVAESDGVIVGGIAGSIGPVPYQKDAKALTEMFWWVGEEYRNGTIGLKLYKMFEGVGKKLGVDKLIMVCTSKTPQLPAIYERMGFVEVERSFMKEF